MRRDFEEDAFETDSYMDGDDFLDPSFHTTGPKQHADTLKVGYSWVQHFGREHPGYSFVEITPLPELIEPPELGESRVALISTAGIYTESQKAFSVSPGEVDPAYLSQGFRQMGDASFRSIPADESPAGFHIAYPDLDTGGVEHDINTIFPIIRLRQLKEENYIESVASVHLSFMGYLPDPGGLTSEARAAVDLLLDDDVNLVLLTPADVLSHQSMAILQREVEAAGIASISVVLCRDVVERIGVPRAVHYRFPFGYSFGDANDVTMQLRILKETLRTCSEIKKVGTIVDLPYEWVEL
jgi:D-proline reductase (dithiol) PrdB